ncbi:lipopolysaccharide transport periplasmic protein LptA [Bacillus subtilis subsp. subtilis]|nr:lipopolysaccharide transport periplasmic protein LptA [Bacillus subtilis subsp. subtilis]
MKILFAAACAISLLVPTFAANAKSTDRNQDMNIEAGAQSGTLIGDGKTTLSQGVVITQGTLDLRSSDAEIYMKDGEAVRAVFTGKQAKLKQQLDDGSWMDASADRIDYDIKAEVLTMTGNYHVKSARGTNTGQKMTYNTRTGEMNSGGDGTRVRTVIPPKNKAAAPAAATPATKATVPTAGSNK